MYLCGTELRDIKVLDGVIRLFVTHGSFGLEYILTEKR